MSEQLDKPCKRTVSLCPELYVHPQLSCPRAVATTLQHPLLGCIPAQSPCPAMLDRAQLRGGMATAGLGDTWVRVLQTMPLLSPIGSALQLTAFP